MPIQDRVAAAKRIDEVLRRTLQLGGFRLKYRISANPPVTTELGDSPELTVDFTGPDGPLLIERNGELLRSLEHVALMWEGTLTRGLCRLPRSSGGNRSPRVPI